ncbi:MAG TPA: hypothetical protein VFI69_05575 [Candidatus Limnocylindrales bacterium]|nr:hypothetical protein [Candidatus Limnocylindrales bacterium]
MTGRRFRPRIAAAGLLLSAPVNAVGLAALIGMFVAFGMGQRPTGMTLGRTNDILGIIGTALMLPAVIEIHALTGPGRPMLRATLLIVGLAAMVSIIWLQILLVTERLPFETQIQYVSLAYAALAVWFVAGGWSAARAGVMADGGRLGAAAAVYVGQPLWAWRWGRRLLELAGDPSARPTITAPHAGEPVLARPTDGS